MNKRFYLLLAICISALFLSSCASFHSWMRAKPQPISDFLPNHELLEKQPDTFPFHYAWSKKEIKPVKYLRVAPVNTECLQKASSWNDFDMKMAGGLEENLQDLSSYMQEQFITELRNVQDPQYFTVTENPNEKDCLVLETAIVAIVPTKAELNAIGFAVEFVVPCLTLLTSPLAEGSIGIECKVRDARTGKIVAMYSTTETDEVAVFTLNNFTWLGSARANIRNVAKMNAECFMADDASTVKRPFPIKLFSF